MSAVIQTSSVDSVRSKADGPRFRYEFATGPADVLESQRLRYRVFARELGARVRGAEHGLDQDRFDAHCWHLLVRDQDSGELVASTRILTDDRAWRIGGFYSAQEFNLKPIAGLPGRVMEIGRTCVDARYRNGAVLGTLWSGIGAFIAEYEFDCLIGCASVEMHDGGANLAALMNDFKPDSYLPPEQRVMPRRLLPTLPAPAGKPLLPPLLKGYLRLGARLGGPPCWDPDFVCADFLVVLRVADMSPRYARHFLGRSANKTTADAAGAQA